VVSFWEHYNFLSPLTLRSPFGVPDAIHTYLERVTYLRLDGPDLRPSYPLGNTIIPYNHALRIPFRPVPWAVVHVAIILLSLRVVDGDGDYLIRHRQLRAVFFLQAVFVYLP